MTKEDLKNIKKYIATEEIVTYGRGKYTINAIILRYDKKARDGDFWKYSLELLDLKAKNSVVIVKPEDVKLLNQSEI